MGGWGKGKGGKWGWGKGWSKGQEKKSPPSLPEDFAVDTEARYKGTVESYWKWHGYGFIKPEQTGLVPGDKLFIHWSSIQTEDRFPFLLKDQEVEFGLQKWTEGWGEKKTLTLRGKKITMPGGANIAVQESVDKEKKTFVGAQNLRYSGKLKFFNPMKGFGYITLDEGYKFEGETVPTEIKVEGSEINAGGKRTRMKLENLAVEFGIVKNRKGTDFLAYNVTLPGGIAVTKETVEHKQVIDGSTCQGEISYYSWQQGWGFITPAPGVVLPEIVKTKLAAMVEALKAKGKTVQQENALYFTKTDVNQGVKAAKGLAVTFTLYTDDKGAGACNIH